LQAALKSSPSPIYQKSFAGRITTGNFDDDLQRIAQCDWIIEVIVERADIKQSLFEKVEKYRKPGTLITSNTSGIPMHLLTEGRSDDFKAHFCGTHFFNPPRYLRLLEIIPGADTKPEVIDFLMDFGQRCLGKTTVLCKDTPAFIANRVGVFSIQFLFHAIKGMGLTVEEVDKLTGPVMGRPKSATFRTCDVVGLDTLIHVAKGLAERCTSDEQHAMFAIPDYVQKMAENGWIGDKNKQGFYKKTKNEKGEKEILSLNLDTLEYHPQKKVRFATLEQAKAIDSLQERTRVFLVLSRVAFGKTVAEHSVWEERIARARIDIEMTRLLCLKAAYMMDTVGNKHAKTEIAMIKVQAPNMALKIIDDAIQAHGGGGVSQDFGLASMYAHQRTLRLADGPDEVHCRTIARLELGKHAGAGLKEKAEEEARLHVPGIR
jgi:3-hydroxyacyl-CoA dehydrogenase